MITQRVNKIDDFLRECRALLVINFDNDPFIKMRYVDCVVVSMQLFCDEVTFFLCQKNDVKW